MASENHQEIRVVKASYSDNETSHASDPDLEPDKSENETIVSSISSKTIVGPDNHNTEAATESDCKSEILNPYAKGKFNKKFPYGQFVTVIVDEDNKMEKSTNYAGGTKKYRCHFDNHVFSGSATRVHNHFFQSYEDKRGTGVRACNFPDPRIVEALYTYVQHAKVKNGITRSSKSANRKRISNSSSFFYSHEEKKIKQSTIEEAFNIKKKAIADRAIARMLYANGLPFSLLRSPSFKEAIQCVQDAGESYAPPSEHRVRTELLDEAYLEFGAKLADWKEIWKKCGCSIVMVGWTDIQQRPLIHIIITCRNGPFFLKAIDCSGHIKDVIFQAKQLQEAIIEVGEKNVVQVITDSVLVCKTAGKMIEATHKNIFWTPCCVHALNNVLYDVSKIDFVKRMVKDACEMQMFIVNHHYLNAIFKRYCKKAFLKLTESRYASFYIMLSRMLEISEALAKVAISEKWKFWSEADSQAGKKVRDKILNLAWWLNVRRLVNVLQPIVDFIRYADTHTPLLGEIYEAYVSMLETLREKVVQEDGNADFYDDVLKPIVMKRWYSVNTPLHMAAYVLNIKWYAKKYRGKRAYPYDDKEVKNGFLSYIKKVFEENEANQLKLEWVAFMCEDTMFLSSEARDDLEELAQRDPVGWWEIHGDCFPNLQKLARRLLSQVASSSAAERNWSSYSFIHRAKSNKLNLKRAEKLLAVHSMIRLEERKNVKYKMTPTLCWDIDPETEEQFIGDEEERKNDYDLVNVPIFDGDTTNNILDEDDEEAIDLDS